MPPVSSIAKVITATVAVCIVLGCASQQDGPEAEKIPEGKVVPTVPEVVNGFTYDNVLMKQSELLMYNALSKYVAVAGVVEQVVFDKFTTAIFLRLSSPEDSDLTVWIANYGQDQDLDFYVDSKIKVLGFPRNRSDFVFNTNKVEDEYIIQGMCILNQENNRIAFIRSAQTLCEDWQYGRPELIENLTSRLK